MISTRRTRAPHSAALVGRAVPAPLARPFSLDEAKVTLASHKNADAQGAGGLSLGATGWQSSPSEAHSVPNRTWYVQWVRHSEIEARSRDGWSRACHGECHHHEYAVLMQAPTGWAP